MATNLDQAESDYDQAKAAREAKATEFDPAKSYYDLELAWRAYRTKSYYDQEKAAHEAKATDSDQAKSDYDQGKAAHEAKATVSDQAKSEHDKAKAALVSEAAMAAASFAHQAKAAAAAAEVAYRATAHFRMHLPDQQQSFQMQSCFSTERIHNLTKMTASTLPRQAPGPHYTSSKAAAKATAKAADAFAKAATAAERAAYCQAVTSRFNALRSLSPEPEDADSVSE